MTTEFYLPVRVYIEDTDAGGIVYYVNYLKYFERARTEFMRSLGQAKAAVADDGLMYVVTDASIRYRQPARLDDELRIGAAVVAASGATLTFAQAVCRHDEVLATGEVRVACVDQASGRPRKLGIRLRDQLNQRVAEAPIDWRPN